MRIVWSAPAQADLRSINSWLTHHATADVAVRMLSAIRSRADVLMVAPRSGRRHDGGDRILVVSGTPYLIRYRVTETQVQVIRVHHERQNWSAER